MITRRDLIVAFAAMAVTASVSLLAQSKTKPLMQSCLFKWNSLKSAQTKTGERRDVFDAPTSTLDRIECHVTTLNPGEAPHPAHQHPEEELLIVKEGSLEAMQNGRTNVVEAGGVIFEASKQPHGVRNAGIDRASYYVLKWFPPGLNKTRSQ
jgi:quercetin dioxygenase-like cupin family protein